MYLIKDVSTYDLFDQYAYFLLCGDKDSSGKSRSLAVLAEITNKSNTFEQTGNRKIDVYRLTKDLKPKMKSKILQFEKAAEGFYQINNDCDNADYICEAMSHLRTSLKEFTPNNAIRINIRNVILNRLYDFSEQVGLSLPQPRFELLKTMVSDIKSNNGEYDHDPLNTTARRIAYSMKKISAKDRYSLLLAINQKTQDKQQYNYSRQLAEIRQEYEKERQEKRELERIQNQERYEQIRKQDFPAAKTNEEKIDLYNEMLGLINDQNWGRVKKFEEKTKIYNSLAELYLQTGDVEKRKHACMMRTKFQDAAYRGSEAARIKGYKSSKSY